MLSLWKAGCEPCVAWKHMWDEIGDGYKKMGDNTVCRALKQKSSKGICQEIKAQTSWRREDSDAHTCTVFFSDLEVEEHSSNEIPLSYFQTWACSQCKIVFHNTLFCLKVGRPSQLTHLCKPVLTLKGLCVHVPPKTKINHIRASIILNTRHSLMIFSHVIWTFERAAFHDISYRFACLFVFYVHKILNLLNLFFLFK